MVKAPVTVSPNSNNQLQQQHQQYQQHQQHQQHQHHHHHQQHQQQQQVYQPIYPGPPLFLKVQHMEMGNETPSTSTGTLTNVSIIAVPSTSRASTSVSVPALITKINQSQPTQSVAPSVHVAPPPPPQSQAPRLALHPIHSIAPMPMQHSSGPWPIVEPVFHFGPGFEHQHYCPTHSQGPQPHEHVVFFHVNAGVSVTFQIAGNREVIRGPVTVPMVSQSGSPPIPMPVQVPPGHVMQQIVDESGTLRHVILSTAQHQQIHGQGGVQGVQPHIHGHFINGVGQHFYSPLPASFPGPGPGPHFHPMPGGHLQPQPMPHSQHSPSPPNSYHKDERTQRQHTKLLRKLDQKQREMNSAMSTPAHSPSPRKTEINGIRRAARNGASSVGTSEDGEESSSVPDEEDDVQSIIDQLSSVQSPQVTEVTNRAALVQWTPPASTESVVLNSRDLRYDVLLSDRGREGKYKVIFQGQSLSCRIRDLRPGQEYSVCLQVHLEELNGSASEATIFTTLPCEPDQPLPPKLLARTKNSLQLRWNAPTDNGSHIIHYILECNDGKCKDFTEITKTKGKQFSIQKLQPSTCYTFRLIAINECGKSPYSDPVTFSTAGNPPQQPGAPILQTATASSLIVAWTKRTQDEEYILQVNDKETGHGFLPAYTGRDTFYECQNLRRATSYQFRLRVENESGQSPWSPEVGFRTLSERPGRPSKPQVKGKIHANHFKAKWDPPTDRGGSEIWLYHLEISSGACWERIYTGADTETACDRLHPGTTYQVKVACEGPGGASPFSELLTVTTEAVVPDAPSAPYCKSAPGPYAAVLQWDKPLYNGGALVTEFEVELANTTVSQTQSRELIYKGKETFCVAKDLQPGEEYNAHVRSINRIGCGPWSDDLTFTAGAAAPFSPEQPNITVRSPTHLNVSWNEPRSNGAAISEYRLECAVNDHDDCYNICYQGVQTSAEVRNLNPFTTYYFKVCASNSAGTSPFSAAASLSTPAAAPNAPIIESYAETSSEVYLAWSEPEYNGSPILHYNIEYADQLVSTEANVLEWTIDKLSPETNYRFKIQAVNRVGTGPYSCPLRVTTKPLPPKPPKLECIGIGHNFLKLKWGDGRNPDFVRYYLELYNARVKEFQEVYNGTSYLYKVNKLQEQCDHVFRICAETDHGGVGDYSDDYIFRTCAALPSSIKAPRIMEHNTTSSNAVLVADRNVVTIEWQHSKNTFSDVIEYILQAVKGKEQDYKLIYRGPETRYALDDLESGVEYTFRVCPVRVTENGDLCGTFSPPLRHFVEHIREPSMSSSSQNLLANTSYTDGIGASPRSAGTVKRAAARITSLFTNRKRLTDQEKAVMLVVFFMVATVFVAAVVRMFIRW